MTAEIRCNEVRKLLRTMPRGGSEETLRRISPHLSKCEGCREIHAGLRKIEEVLLERKRQLDGVASRAAMHKARILAELLRPGAMRKAWLRRPLWASVAALLFVVVAGSALLLTTRKLTGPDVSRPSTPMTADRATLALSSQTLNELAEVVARYEVASVGLPYAVEAVAHEPLFPASVQKYIEPAGTLRGIAESTIKLTRRHET
jgi:hypothetical protein